MSRQQSKNDSTEATANTPTFYEKLSVFIDAIISHPKTAALVGIILASTGILTCWINKAPYTGRVIDNATARPIHGAKVSLEIQGIPSIVYTDSEGIYSFSANLTQASTEARVRVDVQGYEQFDRNISLSSTPQLEDIRLRPLLQSTGGSPPPPPPSSPTPTVTPTSGDCDCSADVYNCSDFTTRAQAQRLYDCCMKKVGYDVHRLDRDSDGIPCESLR